MKVFPLTKPPKLAFYSLLLAKVLFLCAKILLSLFHLLQRVFADPVAPLRGRNLLNSIQLSWCETNFQREISCVKEWFSRNFEPPLCPTLEHCHHFTGGHIKWHARSYEASASSSFIYLALLRYFLNETRPEANLVSRIGEILYPRAGRTRSFGRIIFSDRFPTLTALRRCLSPWAGVCNIFHCSDLPLLSFYQYSHRPDIITTFVDIYGTNASTNTIEVYSIATLLPEGKNTCNVIV